MVKKILISDISKININGGQITSRVEAKTDDEKTGTIKILLPKAIANGKINRDDLGTLDVKTELDPKKITKCGDIVIKLSTPYDACIITKDDEGLLVPSFCAIINDIPEELSREYLIAYLNSTSCFMQIKTLITGSTMAILSVGQIKKIQIPLPDKTTQEEIAKSYIQGVEKIKLLEKITKLEKEYIDSKFLEMEA